jgi:hypothetical protein
LLEPLLLIQGELLPQARGVQKDVLREDDHRLDV